MSDEVVVRVADAEVIRGQDGFSPIFSSEAIPGGHLVRVEDVNGPHEFNVLDGERGKTGATGAKGDKGDPGNYTKPDSGIPKTDLASAVQTSLNKADTAIQLGLTGASVGDLVRVAAVDANGKPTSWRKAPLCEIKTNLNLLENWYFVGGGSQQGGGQFPINQRGQTTYSGSGYGIDRWKSNNSYISLTINNEYVTLASSEGGAYISQVCNKNLRAGDIVSFSVLTTVGLYTQTYTLSDDGSWYGNLSIESKFYHQYRYVNGSFNFAIIRNWNGENKSINIIAVKLELGSEQTLAHLENGAWVLNEIPNYAEELAKCQRYYIKFNKTVFSGFSNSAGSYAYVSTGIIMASEPTISVQNVGSILAKDGENQISDIIIWSTSKPSVGLRIAFATTNTSHANSVICHADSVFTLSCEL